MNRFENDSISNLNTLWYSDIVNDKELERVYEVIEFFKSKIRKHEKYSNEELFAKYYETKNTKIRDIIFEKNLCILISALAYHARSHAINLDIASNISYAFVKSIENFNPHQTETTFKTFAIACMNYEYARYWQSRNGLKNQINKDIIFLEEFILYTNREGYYFNDYETYLNFCTKRNPIDNILSEECKKRAQKIIKTIIENCKLTHLQKICVTGRLGIDCKPQTCQEIADKFNFNSYNIVSQYCINGLKKMRSYLDKNPEVKRDLLETLTTCVKVHEAKIEDDRCIL